MKSVADLSITASARIDGREDLIANLPRPPRTQDDAELILLAYEKWGEDCVKHLLGDFAFAIWDGGARQFFCARDHFGVRPFFFVHAGNNFIFSTTLNEIRKDPRVSSALNETAIGDYLIFGLNQDLFTTTFRDIQRLPPAHSMTIKNGSITVRRYWSPDMSNEVRYRDRHSYVERFRELLQQAVRDRLPPDRVSVSMSGGLDSTSLAALASDSGANVHAFTVVYDHLISDEERFYSTAAADHLGIPISYVIADRYSLFDEQVAGDMDQPEPFLISPLTGQFHSLLRLCAAHSRVALTGYDGDSFMNEPKPSRLKIRSRLRKLLRKQSESPVLPKWIDQSFAKRTYLHDRLKQSLSEPVNFDPKRPSAIQALQSKVWAPLFEGYDPGATKLNLEVRHPFIDLRLVEFLLAIPPAPWCSNKHILRVAMKDRLPASVLNRPKTPLTGDPALQLARSYGVRWLDTFEPNPQLKCFVNLKYWRSIADELIPDDFWPSLRVFALNYWLTNSQPMDRRGDGNRGDYRTSVA